MKSLSIIIFFIVLLCSTLLFAQTHRNFWYQEKVAIRINPFGMIDVFDGNLSAGVTYSLNSRWSATADISYIFYSTYLERNKGASGYIFKPAIRYYLSGSRKTFIESTLWYKRSRYKVEDWLGMNCVNGVSAYEEYKDFRILKKVVGFNIQAGIQKSLIKNNLLRMEIYAGIGVRFKWQEIMGAPKACYSPNIFFFNNTNSIYDPYYIGASIPHGLRLVYVIE